MSDDVGVWVATASWAIVASSMVCYIHRWYTVAFNGNPSLAKLSFHNVEDKQAILTACHQWNGT